MSTETVPPAGPFTSSIPPDLKADLEYAIQLAMTGRRDEAFEARVQAESKKITQQILEEHGVLNVAVDLIREGRDEE